MLCTIKFLKANKYSCLKIRLSLFISRIIHFWCSGVSLFGSRSAKTSGSANIGHLLVEMDHKSVSL